MSDNENLAEDVSGKIKTGEIQPWKAESVLLEEYDASAPEHFRTAALSRTSMLGESNGGLPASDLSSCGAIPSTVI